MKFGFRELVFFIVLLAVPAASGFYVFKPRNEEIRQAEKEIQVKQARLEQLSIMEEKIDDIALEIERGRESIEIIEAKLPSERDVEGILEEVWQIAKRNRQIVKSIKSEKTVPAAMYFELPLKVVMEGQFSGFYQFMLDLEGLERITRIHEMKLKRMELMDSPDGEDLPPGMMRAEFILSIYFESPTRAASN
jgi:type IV pilus assembly protein PilO